MEYMKPNPQGCQGWGFHQRCPWNPGLYATIFAKGNQKMHLLLSGGLAPPSSFILSFLSLVVPWKVSIKHQTRWIEHGSASHWSWCLLKTHKTLDIQDYPKKKRLAAGVRDPQENHLLHQRGYLSLVAVGFWSRYASAPEKGIITSSNIFSWGSINHQYHRQCAGYQDASTNACPQVWQWCQMKTFENIKTLCIQRNSNLAELHPTQPLQLVESRISWMSMWLHGCPQARSVIKQAAVVRSAGRAGTQQLMHLLRRAYNVKALPTSPNKARSATSDHEPLTTNDPVVVHQQSK